MAIVGAGVTVGKRPPFASNMRKGQQVPETRTPFTPLQFQGRRNQYIHPKQRAFLTGVYNFMALGGLILTGIGGGAWVQDGFRFFTPNKSSVKEISPEEVSAEPAMTVEEFLAHPNVQFHFFVPPRSQSNHTPKNVSNFVEVLPNEDMKALQKTVANRYLKLLRDRPDLLKQALSSPLTIRLYQADFLSERKVTPEFEGDDTHFHVAGSQHMDGTMEMSIPELKSGINNASDGYAVDIHEFAHRLDNTDEIGNIVLATDGMFPGLSDAEIAKFKAAREQEKKSILEGSSPVRSFESERGAKNYALTNDEEFLACLVETYFEKPQELQESNPALYEVVENFFTRQRTAQRQMGSAFIALSAGLSVTILAIGLGVLIGPEPKYLRYQQ